MHYLGYGRELPGVTSSAVCPRSGVPVLLRNCCTPSPVLFSSLEILWVPMVSLDETVCPKNGYVGSCCYFDNSSRQRMLYDRRWLHRVINELHLFHGRRHGHCR